ncbi:MAG: ATP-grasp domain-containing protein [Rhizobiales bacterium]|nr:ATP-grasp domain-containing protein [Hyphomicrobiales bacterium]
MFSSVLIANRGEIACRIARTARRLGLRCIGVYSDVDAGARHVRLCDEAHRIGPAPASESYLAIDRLIEIARRTGAECIHPGYGFLAENPAFAEACAAAGIAFVGPPAAAIQAMGLKDRAKALMERAGVPVVPGYYGERQDPKLLKEKAYETGYPLLIKPVAGGGGKGMRRVDRHADFDEALATAMREGAAAFGDARVLIERFIPAPRHIEIQVFADTHGNTIHLNERDCSLQRRHQKVVEEAPAPGMTPALRAAMGAAAVEAARAVGYVGAGTVEFIADSSTGLRRDGFWFMEMNTRLQVEHPVTEATTGLDLVEWQFRIAAGERLPMAQSEVPLDGHAIEARIYAEDPERGFLPSTGRLLVWEPPDGEGIRVDSGVDAGDVVTPFYDPMLAKVIAHGASRDAALARLTQALARTVAVGPRTNVAFLSALCAAEAFRRGTVGTGFIDSNLSALGGVPGGIDHGAVASGVARMIERDVARLTPESMPDEEAAAASPWDAVDGFQLSGARVVAMPVMADGEPIVAMATFGADGIAVSVASMPAPADARIFEGPNQIYVLRGGRQTVVRRREFAETAIDNHDASGVVHAPMHGKVLAVLVEPGAEVRKSQRVAVIEAMKMEHALTAPIDGIVSDIAAQVGSQVAEGAVILRINPAAAEAR